MTTFLQTLETFFWNVLNRPGLSDIADILIVAIIIYELLILTRDTRGSAVLKGLAMLLLIVGISAMVLWWVAFLRHVAARKAAGR